MRLSKIQKQAIVRAVMQDMPPIDTTKRANDIKEAIVKAMSPEVRKLYKTKPQALRATSVEYADPFSRWSGKCVVGDVTDEQIKEIVAPYKKQEDEYHKARNRLECAFEGITTLKQAEATFPEFKKYYPTEEQPTKNLPALANVVADLSKLGWPKDANKLTGVNK